MTLDPADVETLQALEESLWRPRTRFDRAHMEAVLDPDFREIGRSGRIWTRTECLEHEPVAFEVELPLPALEVQAVSADVALVTYVSIARFDDATETALRSSLWVRAGGSWRLRYHQGTPTSA